MDREFRRDLLDDSLFRQDAPDLADFEEAPCPGKKSFGLAPSNGL